MVEPRIISYQQVWMRRGTDDYRYRITFEDGSEMMDHSLPWDRVADAIQLPTTTWEELKRDAK